MDGISYSSASQAQTQSQVSLIALQTAAQAQRQMSNVLAQAAERTQQEVQPAPANPEGMGGNVDTYA